MLAFGFLQNGGLVSADFVRRIAYLLYGDIFSGVLSKTIALFLREWKMKWSSSKRDNKQGFSDARVIQDVSWMAISHVSVHSEMSPGHRGGIRNQRGSRCCFASPWYPVLSCVNDLGPWDQIECQLISEAGNYHPGHVLEWVHFNRKTSPDWGRTCYLLTFFLKEIGDVASSGDNWPIKLSSSRFIARACAVNRGWPIAGVKQRPLFDAKDKAVDVIFGTGSQERSAWFKLNPSWSWIRFCPSWDDPKSCDWLF